MKENNRIIFQPPVCVICGRIHEPVVLDAEKYYRWKGGDRIQDVFTEMTENQREILISGICPECWDELFGRCADEDLELEDTKRSEVPTTGAEAEQMQREQMDRMNAAVELMRTREDYIWDQRELEQRAKDIEAMEKEDEEQRQSELEEWYEAVKEQNEFYCTDPFCPSFGNIFS